MVLIVRVRARARVRDGFRLHRLGAPRVRRACLVMTNYDVLSLTTVKLLQLNTFTYDPQHRIISHGTQDGRHSRANDRLRANLTANHQRHVQEANTTRAERSEGELRSRTLSLELSPRLCKFLLQRATLPWHIANFILSAWRQHEHRPHDL